ncbi:hypothetical protein HUG15_16965 [Salicibibacter cibarius]|uniref:Uncharacterized protein n=1 Tax=Salicibibacter cibarius TaxID=2743000 RepID=A0A7T7CCK6_9BACI|nr:DUF6612 family protein [Salicibibacter cibarius]QQK77099.1 hypothetical protein HUG15_16965 [Salicibibacter cibarius]
MMKIFLVLLLATIVSSCSPGSEHEPVSNEPEDQYTTNIEDPEEIAAILEEAQTVEEEVNSWSMMTSISQDMTGDEINEKTEMGVSSRLMLDPLVGHVEVDMEILNADVDYAMYFSEEATYLSVIDDGDDEGDRLWQREWEKITGEDHEEISEGFYEESIVNYDVLLDHVDELTLTLYEADYFKEQHEDYEGDGLYTLSWQGDSNIYHELLVHEDLVDEANPPASVERFHFSFDFEKDTYHPKHIYTSMNGTTDFEGEVVHIEETMSSSFSSINALEEGDLRVPDQVEQAADEVNGGS